MSNKIMVAGTEPETSPRGGNSADHQTTSTKVTKESHYTVEEIFLRLGWLADSFLRTWPRTTSLLVLDRLSTLSLSLSLSLTHSLSHTHARTLSLSRSLALALSLSLSLSRIMLV